MIDLSAPDLRKYLNREVVRGYDSVAQKILSSDDSLRIFLTNIMEHDDVALLSGESLVVGGFLAGVAVGMRMAGGAFSSDA
jgi:hypothetical protein